MDLNILYDEISNDPLTRGYDAMTDAEIVASLNTANRNVSRNSIQTWEIIEATVPADYSALTSNEKQRYQAFISAGALNPNGSNIVSAFQSMFSGTTTLSNLNTIRNETVSRAKELGLGIVTEGDVIKAKARGA